MSLMQKLYYYKLLMYLACFVLCFIKHKITITDIANKSTTIDTTIAVYNIGNGEVGANVGVSDDKTAVI